MLRTGEVKRVKKVSLIIIADAFLFSRLLSVFEHKICKMLQGADGDCDLFRRERGIIFNF